MLSQGMEPEMRVDALLSLTKIDSEDVIAAVKDHLVRGASLGNAANVREVPQGNLTRALDTLKAVATTVEQIKEMDQGVTLRPAELELVGEWYGSHEYLLQQSSSGELPSREQALADRLGFS